MFVERALEEQALHPTPEDMAQVPSLQRRREELEQIMNEPPPPPKRRRGYL